MEEEKRREEVERWERGNAKKKSEKNQWKN